MKGGGREGWWEDAARPLLHGRAADHQAVQMPIEDAESLNCEPTFAKGVSGPGATFVDRALPAGPNPLAVEPPVVEDELDKRFRMMARGTEWTPDRGRGWYEKMRLKYKRPFLVTTGRHAGRSTVKYFGLESLTIYHHMWKRDFFTSCINMRLPSLFLVMAVFYVWTYFIWATLWYLLWRMYPHCINGFTGFGSAFIFSVVTQHTIGYGDKTPSECWQGGVLLVSQSITAELLSAVLLGIIFARISHPKNRGRTIFISDSAVIARRDGILKFMFRVADIRNSQVIHPVVKAFLYVWEDRRTAEGELIPCRVEELTLNCIDGMLLLPLVMEHTIDERSPLYGHTHDSLQRVGAEFVVSFEGTTEFGQPFLARQSYLPQEIFWGFVFVPIILKAPRGQLQHSVDISRFHEIEPQEGLTMRNQSDISAQLVRQHPRLVPAPLLGENTLVLSHDLAVAQFDGNLRLMFRVGDTYGMQALGVSVKAYLYRWSGRITAEGLPMTYETHNLVLGSGGRFDTNALMLRLPTTVEHIINDDSPLAAWRSGKTGAARDADSEITVVVEGMMYSAGRPMMRQRTYKVVSDVKWDALFMPMAVRPGHSKDSRPQIEWTKFHELMPTEPHPPQQGSRGMNSRTSSYQSLDVSGTPHVPQQAPLLFQRRTLDADVAEGASTPSLRGGISDGGGSGLDGPRQRSGALVVAPDSLGSASRSMHTDESERTLSTHLPGESWKHTRSLANLPWIRMNTDDDGASLDGPNVYSPRRG